MKILIIGSGGREHAIARKISKNDKVQKIYCAPGNGGTFFENKCENINIEENNKLLDFAKIEKIDLTIVGPEKPLVEGIVDMFEKDGLKIFGASKQAAMLEGSKNFSKEFMEKYGIKTAQYKSFTDSEKALKYVQIQEYPLVIKADGLASGKGVYICQTIEEASTAIKEIMLDDIFKGAGSKIVVEEFLEGVEASILSICDGKTIIPFISAKDHKQIYDGGKGPNTGGMGVVAPNPYYTDKRMREFEHDIMIPTLKGITTEFEKFSGIIFFGLMLTKKGTYLLEYNMRLGDPETQSVLELMDSDLMDLIEASLNQTLDSFEMKWNSGFCCNIVLTSEGYPDMPKIGYKVDIQKDIINNIYIAGAKMKDGTLITSGGRVASVVAVAKTLDEAREKAYSYSEKIIFKGKYMRSDIGI